MSYLHCPTCRRAYNVATQPACPTCTTSETSLLGTTEAIVAAAEALARALERANPMQLAKARTQLAAKGLLDKVRAIVPRAVQPLSPVVPRGQQALLGSIAMAMLTRLPRLPAAARKLLSN